MTVTLKKTVDLYSNGTEQNPEGRLIKKGAIIKIYVELEDIKYSEEVLNAKGKVSKSKCTVFLRDVGPIIVNHSVKYIQELKKEQDEPKVIGFLQHLKKRKNGNRKTL